MAAPVPPTIVNNPDGTVSIKGSTVTYVIDPSRKFSVTVDSNSSTVDYAGKSKLGTPVYMGSLVAVDITSAADPSATVLNSYQVWRGADLLLSYDPAKLEFVEAKPDTFLGDKNVVDWSSMSGEVVSPGIVRFKVKVMPPPEARTPPAAPAPFQWNLGGFVTSGSRRHLAKIWFKVKSDFYFPTSLPTDVKLLPSATVGSSVLTSSVDGGAVPGTNVIGSLFNSANGITSGPSPSYTVDQVLEGPAAPVKAGDPVNVKVLVRPTKPQRLSSVTTLFVWDPSKLEFMGLDKTGAKACMSSSIMTGALGGTVNESAVPKDGNAQHIWMCNLGDKSYFEKDTLIVTLKFKAVADFHETKVEPVLTSDPRLAGLTTPEETRALGSVVPGASVTLNLAPAVIQGIL